MEEVEHLIELNEIFNTKLGENKGSMKINRIRDNLAIMDILYN